MDHLEIQEKNTYSYISEIEKKKIRNTALRRRLYVPLNGPSYFIDEDGASISACDQQPYDEKNNNTNTSTLPNNLHKLISPVDHKSLNPVPRNKGFRFVQAKQAVLDQEYSQELALKTNAEIKASADLVEASNEAECALIELRRKRNSEFDNLFVLQQHREQHQQVFTLEQKLQEQRENVKVKKELESLNWRHYLQPTTKFAWVPPCRIESAPFGVFVYTSLHQETYGVLTKNKV